MDDPAAFAKKNEQRPDKEGLYDAKGTSDRTLDGPVANKKEKNDPTIEVDETEDGSLKKPRKPSNVQSSTSVLSQVPHRPTPPMERMPPRTHYKAVNFEFNYDPSRELEISLSTNLVVRSIARSSQMFFHLIVGDQIIEVNDQVPMKLSEFNSAMKQSAGLARITVVRPWNTRPVDRSCVLKRSDNSTYLIADVHRMTYPISGFDISTERKTVVKKLKPHSRGAHAFIDGDRILQLNGEPIENISSLKALRKKYNSEMEQRFFCSFTLERSISLHSSPNPSVWAARVPGEIEMGEDAAEIGARESTRHYHSRDKYKPKGILICRDEAEKKKLSRPDDVIDGRSVMAQPTVDEDEEPVAPKVSASKASIPKLRSGEKKNGRKKRKNRKVAYEPKKTEIHRTISDVKEGEKLQKVTSKSGLISFVKNYMSFR